MSKYIIDRSRWRWGGPYYDEKRGYTRLLNQEGFMCCLGFLAKQCGCSAQRILNVPVPRKINWKVAGLDRKALSDLLTPDGAHSEFSSIAIDINDAVDLSKEDREDRLIGLGKNHGIELEFISEYPE